MANGLTFPFKTKEEQLREELIKRGINPMAMDTTVPSAVPMMRSIGPERPIMPERAPAVQTEDIAQDVQAQLAEDEKKPATFDAKFQEGLDELIKAADILRTQKTAIPIESAQLQEATRAVDASFPELKQQLEAAQGQEQAALEQAQEMPLGGIDLGPIAQSLGAAFQSPAGQALAQMGQQYSKDRADKIKQLQGQINEARSRQDAIGKLRAELSRKIATGGGMEGTPEGLLGKLLGAAGTSGGMSNVQSIRTLDTLGSRFRRENQELEKGIRDSADLVNLPYNFAGTIAGIGAMATLSGLRPISNIERKDLGSANLVNQVEKLIKRFATDESPHFSESEWATLKQFAKVRGKNLMKEYVQNAEATVNAWAPKLGMTPKEAMPFFTNLPTRFPQFLSKPLDGKQTTQTTARPQTKQQRLDSMMEKLIEAKMAGKGK